MRKRKPTKADDIRAREQYERAVREHREAWDRAGATERGRITRDYLYGRITQLEFECRINKLVQE